jgi:acylglycerol lipase
MKKYNFYSLNRILLLALLFGLLQLGCSTSEDTAPKSVVISGSSFILGSVNPSIEVELIPQDGMAETFTDQALLPENWELQTATAGLAISSITKISDTKLAFAFAGTVADNTLTLSAKREALSSDHDSKPITLFFGKVDSTVPGLRLYHSKNLVEDAKAVIVIIHGLAEHSGRYDYVTAKLNAAGYSVYRHDHKGHGQSDGEKGYIDSSMDFIEDANLIVDRAIQENPSLPVYMLGHSMGGLVTAMYGIAYPDKLAGQVISAPALADKVQDPPNSGNFRDRTDEDVAASIASENYTSVPPMIIPNTFAETVCTDPDVRAAYAADPLNLTEYSYKLAVDMFAVGAHYVTTNMNTYRYPILILHGEADVIVLPDFSLRFFNEIVSTDKQRKTYVGCYHEILNEKETKDATGAIVVVGKDTIIADILAWLDAHVKV